MKTFFKLSIIGVALLIFAAACGSSDSDDSASSSTACPDKVVVQTDWFPEPEHGYLYQLIGTEGTIDTTNGTYTGLIGGTDITLEIRAGGPYINNSSPAAQFYSDNDIYMAYVDTSSAIEGYRTTPAVAVFANFEVGPQILMWNPSEYDFETFQDIGNSGATVLHFGGANYIKYLVDKDLVDPSNTDGSYDGSPDRFIAEGNLVQQGFATAEPYRYEFDIEAWQKPVDYLLIHDSGHQIYQSALSVKPETIENDAECLRILVPLMQQGLVDYMSNPTPMNIRLDELVKALDSFWTSSIEAHNWSSTQMRDIGLVTDGGNGYVGDMDANRIQTLIDELTPIYRDENIDGFDENDPPLRAADIFTNEFLDPSISLGY